jgi:hypothetical protein
MMYQQFSKITLFISVLAFLNLFMFAQQKDSVVSKPNEIKEEVNVAQKKKIHLFNF